MTDQPAVEFDSFTIREWEQMMKFVGFTNNDIERIVWLAKFIRQQRIEVSEAIES